MLQPPKGGFESDCGPKVSLPTACAFERGAGWTPPDLHAQPIRDDKDPLAGHPFPARG